MMLLCRVAQVAVLTTILGPFAIACQAFGIKGSGDHPKSIENAIDAWTKGEARVESVCVDGLKSWIAVVDDQIRAGGPLPSRMTDYIDGLMASGPPPRFISFHTDGWVVINSNGGVKCEGLAIPAVVDEHIQGALNNGATLLSVSFTKKGWVVVTDKSVKTGGAIPKDMQDLINDLRQKNIIVRSASLAPNGAWIVNFR